MNPYDHKTIDPASPEATQGEKEMKAYNHAAIERKWQEKWEADGIYKVADNVPGKENYYTLVEFIYPSGNAHVGHWYAFAVPDIFARYKRMQGFNVLYPMGFDAFGLPAENAAIKRGRNPKDWTYENIDLMRKQLASMGAMFDWDREVVSCDPAYYKWTQWMFNEFLKKDLVYRDTTSVNWCPKDQTILANEQVVDGKCERCGTEVIQKNQEQWMLRITKYADRLIDDLDTLDWPHAIKQSQKNWIGRSEGSEIDFKIKLPEYKEFDLQESVKVFTTRADTLFGVTYIVLAPEHPLVEKLLHSVDKTTDSAIDAVAYIHDYINTTKKKSELDRQQSKEKTGVQLQGITAINPVNGEEVPVWIADYVLVGYGTGAVMAVPAHDERDFEFANKYNLPIKQVVVPENRMKAVVVAATLENDAVFKEELQRVGIDFTLAVSTISNREHIRVELKKEGLQEFINLVQKYITGTNWVEIIGSENIIVKKDTIYKDFLNQADEWFKKFQEWEPLIQGQKNLWDMFSKNAFLNEFVCYRESGKLVNSGKFEGMISEEAKKAITESVGGKLVKTYRLRDWGISRQRYWGVPIPIVYDPSGAAHPIPAEHLPWLLPTDVDHTPDGTSPLARSKELIDRTEKIFGAGWRPEVETMDTFVDSSWYFYRYLDNKNNDTFADPEKIKKWMPIDLYMGGAEHTTMHLLYSRFWVKALHDLGLVDHNESYIMRRNRGLILGPDGEKMSKSKGNVIDPDAIVDRLGADTVRLYLAFMGPYGTTASFPWDPNGVVGVRRFLERVWSAQKKVGNDITNEALVRTLHKTIKKVGEDIEKFSFNTAISTMMIFMNEFDKQSLISITDWKVFLKLLSSFAPHMTEELWHLLGETTSIHVSDWPIYNPELVVDTTVTIGVQVNGKVRAEIEVAVDADSDTVKSLVLEIPAIIKWIDSKEIKKFIYVPGKIISIVI